jgi:hypothetical protein
MKFFVRSPGDPDVGIASLTFAVTADVPEEVLFFDRESRDEARSILAAAFAAILDDPVYVWFESDPSVDDPLDELEDYELLGEDDDDLTFDSDRGTWRTTER